MRKVLVIGIILTGFIPSLTATAQKSILDTVNCVDPGIRSITATYIPMKKGKKLDKKHSKEISSEYFYMNGIIEKRTLNDVIYEHNKSGDPIKATFQVAEILNGTYTKYWKWDYSIDPAGQIQAYTISRSKYGKKYEPFRYDSIVRTSGDGDGLYTVTTYHKLAPFSKPAFTSSITYKHGKIAMQRDAGDGNGFVERRFSYDSDGNLTSIKMYDEENNLFYTEEFAYENGKRVERKIIKESQTDRIGYTYDESGYLASEILYSPKGKPYATIIYTYEHYPK